MRQGHQGGDMVALGHAHRPARIGDAHRHAEMGEGAHEGTHRRTAAVVHHGAGPIQNQGLEHHAASIAWEGAGAPSRLATVSSPIANAVLAPVPEVTITSRTPSATVSVNAVSGPEG